MFVVGMIVGVCAGSGLLLGGFLLAELRDRRRAEAGSGLPPSGGAS